MRQDRVSLPFFQLLQPLIITFTSYQFSLHLQKHRTYIYLLCLLHTLTIYINAYITSAEFVLTGFCLPLIWRLCEYVENRVERPQPSGFPVFRVKKLLFRITSGSPSFVRVLLQKLLFTKFVQIFFIIITSGSPTFVGDLFILSYEKSRSRLVQSSIY